MTSKEHLEILAQGVEVWNEWREKNPDVRPDLTGANLRQAHLSAADLRGADLRQAHLIEAKLKEADLRKADLRGTYLWQAELDGADLRQADLRQADLRWADLSAADLRGADLRQAHLMGADLRQADLKGVDLSQADLRQAILIRTNLEGTELTNCWIYGISAWDLKLKGANQSDLIISDYDEPIITVDNLQVAQFIYLLLNNEEIRDVIDTITSKVVLILGRFTDQRKPILKAIREELRNYNYLPVLFDFKKPISKSFIDTVGTLAHMARFVIADVTDPKIVLEEIPHIVRNITVPVIPLLLEGEQEPITIPDLRIGHPLLLDTHYYKDLDDLIASLEEKVITPAETKAKELRPQ